ncbi:STAS domain-containing protein [Aquimonas voraii]|uniref:Anti-anti-sigma regulatory factor (Antagonist of anti-sigma factor) n=1 Tax=Aquimonas voraii TaxID=265719 RepID=A0A1G6W682_9GAMM|nr:STAS domain-containing protein [Aquimonas voraii]SDD61450.1 Anti-anti-sigma regulatory factor (antagonist of anti-sigma factor) [Aquimonas voraii]
MSTIQIPEDLGIEAAEPLLEQLRGLAKGKKPLKLDGSKVSRLHAASLQVLAALVLQRRGAGLETQIENPSDEFKAAARISGLGGLFGWSSP